MANIMRKLSLKPRKDKTPESPRDASPAPAGALRQSTQATAGQDHVDSVTSQSVSVDRVSTDMSTHSKKSTMAEVVQKPKTLAGKLHLPGTHTPTPERVSDDLPRNREGSEMSKNQLKKFVKHQDDERKADWHEKQSEDLEKRREREVELRETQDPPENKQHYGWSAVNNYAGPDEGQNSTLIKLSDLKYYSEGAEITFRARVHNYRKMSSKLAFFIFRQQTYTIQGVLQKGDQVSEHMVHWAEHTPLETIVDVHGILQTPKAKEGEVTGALVHDKELMIYDMHVISKLDEHIAFSVVEAEVSQEEADAPGSTRHHVSDRARLNARILDLRTTTSQAIFRVQAAVCHLFRGYLDTQGFIEIHTPKLQGGATESGASVFKLDYFGRTAFLAQSPQLAKQMSIAADFGRVYEIGAVFRAENSNTHRHLTEYTGLDLEMQIDVHYHEMLRTVDNTLKSIFEGVYKRCGHEIEMIKHQFPHEDLIWLAETPVLKFRDAIQMLNDTGWLNDEGKPLPLDEDLGTRDEIQLGRVVKEKYKTDYYIMDKFPTSARPFYTMQDPSDPAYTNSFDVFVRGQEIISGGQRVHDAGVLVEQMKKVKMDPDTVEEYVQGFRWGAPPHAGAGIGLERLVMLMLQLNDIRAASLFPRDPKSLPDKAAVVKLRHPEASTLHPPWEANTDKTTAHKDLQPLEKLIANYGDATNTSWLEERTVIWRDGETGAAVGYVPHNGFAITIGDPLCHVSQYTKVAATYLGYIKEHTNLKPLWLLCGSDTEEVLGAKFDWRTFSCAAEQRLDLHSNSNSVKSFSAPEIQRKIRHADKEGLKIKVIAMGDTIPDEFRKKVDSRIDEWLGNRKSHQHVHLTDVHPWQDEAHRQFHYGVLPDGTLATLVIMAQLSTKHGWQVKFALDFPNSPNGAIEATVIDALKAVQAKGETSATFGGGASNDFKAGYNLKGTKVKMLSKAYNTIATDLKLTQKTEFREKLGAQEDPIYVCYPPKGLGPKGVQAILSFFED